METILYFKCRCHVCVPFITSKLFPNKYLGIQKQWENEECPLESHERTAQYLQRGKSTQGSLVLMPYCTWCCRIRTFMLNWKDKDAFHANATNPLLQSPEWACLCYLRSQYLSQLEKQEKRWSSLKERELNAKGEQRENVQSQHLSIGNVSGVGTGCINAFLIWRSAQEELHRLAPLSKIYSSLLRKYMHLQNHITASCSDEEQPVLHAGHFQWKIPLSWTSQRHPIFDAQIETSVSERPDQILHGILWQLHWLQFGYMDVNQHRRQHDPYAENVFLLNKSLLIINTLIYLQEALSKGMPQWGNPAAPERGYHSLSSTILDFSKRNWHTEKSILQGETIAIAVQALGLRYNNTIFFWVH